MAVVRQYERFEHERLDTTQPSIRLISIDSNLSPEGLVQGSIHHATTNAQYNCLSYVWGSADQSHALIVNGKRLSINKNLHDFLTAVRTFKYRESGEKRDKHLRANLWIDAICIDQDLTDEKNHQVAQMGKIYTNAEKVIMWLGNSHGKASKRLFDTGMRKYLDFICSNVYWSRAWIAQEVLLARLPVLMIADRLVPFRGLVKRYHCGDWWVYRKAAIWRRCRFKLLRQSPDRCYADSSGVLRAEAARFYRTTNDVPEPPRNIAMLLSDLHDLQCTLAHDRIFSLLELAEEGTRIAVDYGMTLVDLVYHVFEARTDKVCFCEIWVVASLLRLSEEEFDPSVPHVYAQWEESRPCMSLKDQELGQIISTRLGNPEKGQQTYIQAPIQRLTSLPRPNIRICDGVWFREPGSPVVLKRGLVHDWRRVVADDLDSDGR
ncbi:hypothetical protein N0V86_007512 [Didymella sp. IMI 355093]|nr:hypothetical protein N0V86_007512 [Didymella sp. IMI 355093]